MNRWVPLSCLLTVAAAGASFYLYVVRYPELPDVMPLHWNIHGEVDATMPKENMGWVFFLMPGVMALLVLLTEVLPWMSPKPFSVESFKDTWAYVMFLAVALMGYLHGAILWATLHPQTADVGKLFFGGTLLFFVAMGNSMGKIRRNQWMGVRTPWTLASDSVWIGTHRVSAWLFMGYGLIGLAALMAGAPVLAVVPGLLFVIFAPIAYSAVLYKRLEKEGRL